MLHLFFAVAFSAVPLTLYVPPVRSLNLFIATMEDLFRESILYVEVLVLVVLLSSMQLRWHPHRFGPLDDVLALDLAENVLAGSAER
ncbi:hypothetical protein RJ639_006898 [Escallonia herrerae]|uniref:Uncharacterized protein n=1 Tax=Escallonia herrerae TaxID=1293975 RepID=A0AA88W133_9ASTE|nr:hypothetical protein RJ639_006898 [Escallonia herrerae]